MNIASICRSDAPAAALLIRLAVGGIFLSEGVQKFIYSASRGAGRFEKIGLPAAEILGPMVGGFEILCGALVLAGLFTRLASIPLLAIMFVALITTKVPILLGHSYWGLSLRELPGYGFWSMAHEARTDFAMLTGSLFLLFSGAGPLSLDRLICPLDRHGRSPGTQASGG